MESICVVVHHFHTKKMNVVPHLACPRSWEQDPCTAEQRHFVCRLLWFTSTVFRAFSLLSNVERNVVPKGGTIVFPPGRGRTYWNRSWSLVCVWIDTYYSELLFRFDKMAGSAPKATVFFMLRPTTGEFVIIILLHLMTNYCLLFISKIKTYSKSIEM